MAAEDERNPYFSGRKWKMEPEWQNKGRSPRVGPNDPLATPTPVVAARSTQRTAGKPVLDWNPGQFSSTKPSVPGPGNGRHK